MRAKNFPAQYRGGFFIALHGNGGQKIDGGQTGHNVVFVPRDADGKIGAPVVFADGFAGPPKLDSKGRPVIRYRPVGLAVGADGALYVADSVQRPVFGVSLTANSARRPACGSLHRQLHGQACARIGRPLLAQSGHWPSFRRDAHPDRLEPMEAAMKALGLALVTVFLALGAAHAHDEDPAVKIRACAVLQLPLRDCAFSFRPQDDPARTDRWSRRKYSRCMPTSTSRQAFSHQGTGTHVISCGIAIYGPVSDTLTQNEISRIIDNDLRWKPYSPSPYKHPGAPAAEKYLGRLACIKHEWGLS